jgi:hypothetical protein
MSLSCLVLHPIDIISSPPVFHGVIMDGSSLGSLVPVDNDNPQMLQCLKKPAERQWLFSASFYESGVKTR